MEEERGTTPGAPPRTWLPRSDAAHEGAEPPRGIEMLITCHGISPMRAKPWDGRRGEAAAAGSAAATAAWRPGRRGRPRGGAGVAVEDAMAAAVDAAMDGGG